MPALLQGLIDDAAVFPPGSAPLPAAVAAHRRHRAGWYADLVGPLLVPATKLPELAKLLHTDEHIEIGLIGDVPLDRLDETVRQAGQAADGRIRVRQVEAPAAKRGDDPRYGLDLLLRLARHRPDLDVYAEIPLATGLLPALDRVAQARHDGVRIAAKFRTGGLTADLFPSPMELAAVITACRDRRLPFKLTAGLHHAIRHTDPATGFPHHGYLNVLAAGLAAARGGEAGEVTEWLEKVEAAPLVEAVAARRHETRPLWIGYGSCSIDEPLEDLIGLGLLNGGHER
ncbi:MAG TPA: hypothetical protein VF174_08120 [Micromonosporaceae bacterium]